MTVPWHATAPTALVFPPHQAEAAVARLLSELRGRLADFAHEDAAGQAIDVVAREPQGTGAQLALGRLFGYVRPGTEAVTALTALAAAVNGLLT